MLPAPPDHMVFDLDPGRRRDHRRVLPCRHLVADCLDEGRSGCWPKTSGSKGLQLYVPLSGRPTWDKVRERAHGIAVQLEQDHPDLVVSNMRKSLRGGKVLIDWSQNHPAKTTVAAYSLRARDEPTVSTPVTWDEVDGCVRSGRSPGSPLHCRRRDPQDRALGATSSPRCSPTGMVSPLVAPIDPLWHAALTSKLDWSWS